MGKLLTSVDWSASVRDFRLAVCILNDQVDEALAIMKQIGKRGELIHEISYHQWPLFNSLRESAPFHKVYEEVFGYPFYLRAEKNAEDARTKLEQAIDHVPSTTSPTETKEKSEGKYAAPKTAKRRAKNQPRAAS